MKIRLFSSLLLLLSVAAAGQNFEGSMVWSVRNELTDPGEKAAAEARMNEVMKALNSPEALEAMEKDPAYRKQMEQMRMMMQLMTQEYEYKVSVKIRGKDLLIVNGALPHLKFLHKSDGKMYILDEARKAFAIMSAKDHDTMPDQRLTVTKTGDIEQITGYPAHKYMVNGTSGDTNFRQVLWTTQSLPQANLKLFLQSEANPLFMQKNEQVEGFPLRSEIDNGTTLLRNEMISIREEPLPPHDFILPPSFKEVPESELLPAR